MQTDLGKFLEKIAIEGQLRAHFSIFDGHNIALVGGNEREQQAAAEDIAKAYKNAGILDQGHVVHVGRYDVTGLYVGETAAKLTQALNRAVGGVLLVEDAPGLRTLSARHEFFTALIAGMEENRGRCAIVLAGQAQDMDDFVQSEPVFGSRLRNTVKLGR